jgi:hypothetical protein
MKGGDRTRHSGAGARIVPQKQQQHLPFFARPINSDRKAIRSPSDHRVGRQHPGSLDRVFELALVTRLVILLEQRDHAVLQRLNRPAIPCRVLVRCAVNLDEGYVPPSATVMDGEPPTLCPCRSRP